MNRPGIQCVPDARIREASRVRRRKARGQAMTEVIVTIALVAIATIGIAGVFGDNIRSLFAGSSDSLAGNSSVANPGSRVNLKTQKKTLKTFGENNSAGGQMHGG